MLGRAHSRCSINESCYFIETSGPSRGGHDRNSHFLKEDPEARWGGGVICPRTPGHSFFLLFFKNYMLLIMLGQLSQFTPLCPPTQHIPLPQAAPTPLFVSMGPAVVVWLPHFLFCAVHSGPSVVTNLCLLILSPLHPFLQTPLPSFS